MMIFMQTHVEWKALLEIILDHILKSRYNPFLEATSTVSILA